MARKSSGDSASDRKKESKRNFLKFAMAFSTLLAVGGIASVLKSITNPGPSATGTTRPSGSRQFPRVKVAQLTDLTIGQPIAFNYPLDNEPNILVKLGTKADGGVGPDEDIVGFSNICQHLGCIYGFQAPGSTPACNSAYKTDGPVGYCCCHGSVFDLANKANVIAGPSPRPQPQVLLEVDPSGNIFATGMGPPTIFGHDTGSNDVSGDLQGGNPVG
ncbi:MAG: arsenate reductase (azurin) small subunit [Candidatus Bathyarchaeia archaeon]